jgi:fructose-1,6-bisphosphatase II
MRSWAPAARRKACLTAAAMRCLNGEIFARLVVSKPEHEERCRAMGITDLKKIYRSKDLAPARK